MNHRRFTLLHARCLLLRWQREMTVAMNTSAIYRSGMRDFDPLPKAADFLFTLRPGERRRTVKPKQTREQVADVFRLLATRPKNDTEGSET